MIEVKALSKSYDGGKTFSRIFTLGDWVEVSDAGFRNGMLVINLQVNTPEENKPKTINIG